VTDPLLAVDHLVVDFPQPHGRVLHAVADVSLGVGRGEILGVVGESGCGKTTLARCISGRSHPSSGTVSLDGMTLGSSRTVAERRAVQMVFQDPFSSLNPRMSIGRMLAELLRVNEVVPRSEVSSRCRSIVGQVGLPSSALDQLPGAFSGGQRQRIAFARAIAVEPRIIVADEPLSSLDVSVQATILELIRRLREDLGTAFVFISHDLGVVRQLADTVAVMYLGRVVEKGSASTVFGDPRHPYTRALIEAAPRLSGDRSPLHARLSGEPPSPIDLPSGCAFHPRCPRAEAICSTEAPHLADVDAQLTGSSANHVMNHQSACHFRDEVKRP